MRSGRIIITAALVLALSACGTSRRVESSRIEQPLELRKTDYEVVASFRYVSKKQELSYDRMLREVRKKHGPDVDVANLKIDVHKRGKTVVNGYVIRYK